jgi:hypothetical protein
VAALDLTGSESCPAGDSGVRSVKPSGYTNKKLVNFVGK